MVRCYITGNTLKDNSVILCSEPSDYVQITNIKDALVYKLPEGDWIMFSNSSQSDSNFTTHLTEDEIRRTRGFVFYENQKNNFPDIANIKEDLKKNKIPKMPTVYERAILLLEHFVKNTKELGNHIMLKSKMTSLSYSLNINETLYLIKEYLEKIGYISEYGKNNFIVSPKGFEKVEELKASNINSKEAFIIMPFNNQLNQLSKSIKKAVRETGYIPIRIDENLDNKKIDDEIIVHINKSRFVVCDLTPLNSSQNGNVYFEAGYAMGRKIEIIWTCEKKSIEKLPFDIRQYKCIGWEKDKLSNFGTKLRNTILSIIDNNQN